MTTHAATSRAAARRASIDHCALLATLARPAASPRQPLRGAALAPSPQHRAVYAADARLYALSALAPTTTPSQRAHVLLTLLASSRVGLDVEARATCEQICSLLAGALCVDQVVDVLLALRRARVNHRHASRAALRFVLVSERAEQLAATRPRALRDIVEHALGRRVARAAARAAGLGQPLSGRLRRIVAGEADAVEAQRRVGCAARVLAALFAVRPVAGGDALSLRRRARQQLAQAHVEAAARLSPDVSAPQRVTAADRGDIAQTLHHALRGGMTSALRRELSSHVTAAVAQLPRYAGHLAVVVDASASTEGYGERRYCCIAQSIAAALVLERVAHQTTLVRVGGSEQSGVPHPLGATDLADAVLVALERRVDAIVVLTDGYENRCAGDLAALCATLAPIGVHTPVVVATVTFTPHDDMSLRRPLAALADGSSPARELRLWHQAELWMLLFSALCAVPGDAARATLVALLERRLRELVA